MEELGLGKLFKSTDTKSVQDVVRLISSRKDYSLSLSKYVSFKNFWTWKKHGLLNLDNIQDGAIPKKGIIAQATLVNLEEFFWIRIIASMKQFNMRVERIQTLKEEIHRKIDIVENLKGSLSENDLKLLNSNDKAIEVSYLFLLIYRLIMLRHDVKLIIKEGECAYFYDPTEADRSLEDVIDYNASLVIPLKKYLMDLMIEEKNHNYLKSYNAMSDTEAKLLNTLKEEDVQYFSVKQKKGKALKQFVDKDKRIEADLALANYLIKDRIHDITIKTKKDRINYNMIKEHTTLNDT